MYQVKSSSIKSKIEVKDAMNGDNDFIEEFLSRTDVESVKRELKTKKWEAKWNETKSRRQDKISFGWSKKNKGIKPWQRLRF